MQLPFPSLHARVACALCTAFRDFCKKQTCLMRSFSAVFLTVDCRRKQNQNEDLTPRTVVCRYPCLKSHGCICRCS